MSAEKLAGATWPGAALNEHARLLHCEDWVLDKAFTWDLLTRTRNIMPNAHGKPKPIEAQMKAAKRQEREENENPPVPQENERAREPSADAETFQSDDWWTPSPPATD